MNGKNHLYTASDRMIKLIALDLDGTLLNSKKEITPATRSALLALEKKGIRLVLSSGRPTYGLFHEMNQLEMKKYNGYLLSYNGAALHEASTMKPLHQKRLDWQTSKRLIEHSRLFADMTLMVFEEGRLLCENPDAYCVQAEAWADHLQVEATNDVLSALKNPPFKFLFACPPERLKQLKSDFSAPFEKELCLVNSTPFYLEVIDKSVSKGSTLSLLLKHLQLEKDELLAFGDGMNDLEMLKMAGISVCMGNAEPELKKHADLVTKSCDEDGIAWAIDFLQREGKL